jgi:hypothetical protein
MGKLTNRIELLANVAIIVVAGLLSVVLVKGMFYRNPPMRVPTQQIKTGTKLKLPDVDWQQKDQTLLITLQKGCHYCAESAPFYQRLVREAESQKKTQLVAVLPQEPTESRQYLSDLSVPISSVKQATLGSLQVAGTPTLIMVNREGVVTDVWVGKLPPEKESEVLNKLHCDTCGS